jgi:hypothetical protein
MLTTMLTITKGHTARHAGPVELLVTASRASPPTMRGTNRTNGGRDAIRTYTRGQLRNEAAVCSCPLHLHLISKMLPPLQLFNLWRPLASQKRTSTSNPRPLKFTGYTSEES